MFNELLRIGNNIGTDFAVCPPKFPHAWLYVRGGALNK
jgi:hypothetical protein